MFKDHGGAALPGAINMQARSAYRNQFSGTRVKAQITSLAGALVDETANREKYKKRSFGEDRVAEPSPKRLGRLPVLRNI